jgi:hypothetical protein
MPLLRLFYVQKGCSRCSVSCSRGSNGHKARVTWPKYIAYYTVYTQNDIHHLLQACTCLCQDMHKTLMLNSRCTIQGLVLCLSISNNRQIPMVTVLRRKFCVYCFRGFEPWEGSVSLMPLLSLCLLSCLVDRVRSLAVVTAWWSNGRGMHFLR